MAKVPVVPMCIFGTEKFLPINDKDMGKEEFHSADITVRIGKPLELLKSLRMKISMNMKKDPHTIS